MKNDYALAGCCFLLGLILTLFHCADNLSPLEERIPLTVTCDTVVAIHDSLAIRLFTGVATERNVRFVWFVDTPNSADTTSDSILVRRFSIGDTGKHLIVIKAFDSRGGASDPESLFVLVGYHRPIVAITGDTLTDAPAPYSFHIASTVIGARVARYEWYIDDPRNRRATIDTVIAVSWLLADTGGHTIVVRAVDEDGIASFPDSLALSVGYHRPAVSISGDSTVCAREPYSFHLSSTPADAQTLRYEWYIDDPRNRRATIDTVIAVSWLLADTGGHTIVVRAVDEDGIASYPDSLTLSVSYHRPTVSISGDSTVCAREPYSFHLSSTPADARTLRYEWYIDDPRNRRATIDTVIAVSWLLADTGGHTIVVRAVDEDGIASFPDSLALSVGYHRPAVSISGDSTVCAREPYSFQLSSTPADARTLRYEWYIDDPRNRRTTIDTVIAVSWLLADTGGHTIVVRAVDEDGIASYPDSLALAVSYHRPTVSISGNSTVYAREPYSFHLSSTPADARTLRYEWYIDDPRNRRATIDTVIAVSWLLADTGGHTIVVRAVDEDGIASFPDTLALSVGYHRPYLMPIADTSVKVNTTLILRFSAGDPFNSISGFRYSIDNSTAVITTPDGIAAVRWQVADSGAHRIVVRSVNGDGMASLPETLTVTVTAAHPTATLSAAASFSIGDTIQLQARATDPDGTIAQYRWSIDNGFWFATDSSRMLWTFGNSAAAAGRHTARVVAVDDDGLLSDTVGIQLLCILNRPVAAIAGPADTGIYANIPLTIHATAFDTNGSITAYRWMIDGRSSAGSLRHDSLTLNFNVTEAGVHLVTLTVTDDDSLESPTDTMRIRVFPGTPSVTAMPDIVVSSNDTVRLTCAASDPNGTIVRYLWGFSGNGWDDSTATPRLSLLYRGMATVRVITGVRDNDGLVATDTVMVRYNRPPDPIMMLHPGVNDTMVFTQSAARCTVSFAWSAPDPDNDSVSFTLSFGPSTTPDSLVEIYTGNSPAASAVVTRPGRYFWRLTVRDSWGHSRVKTGMVVVLREYRICFVGHSVVVGIGCDGVSGGFRGGVLDSLRKTLGAYERLRVVGPLSTDYMRGSEADDSCLAISGTTAREIFLMFTYDQADLFADIWVLMIGVNDNYSLNEQAYTVSIMESMVSRNPASRLYVVNGYRLPDSYYIANYYRPYFNQVLADSAAVMNARGAQVSLIDSYTLLCTADEEFEPAWFADDVHPNQIGYDMLVGSIYSAMKNSSPPALPPRP